MHPFCQSNGIIIKYSNKYFKLDTADSPYTLSDKIALDLMFPMAHAFSVFRFDTFNHFVKIVLWTSICDLPWILDLSRIPPYDFSL